MMYANIKESGFTLVEVLISLFIFALISAGTMGAMFQTFAAKDRLDIASAELADVAAFRSILRADMGAMVLRPMRDGVGGIENFLVTTRNPADPNAILTFTRLGRSNPAGAARGQAERVRYLLRDGQFIRESLAHENPAQRDRWSGRVLLENIENIELEYEAILNEHKHCDHDNKELKNKLEKANDQHNQTSEIKDEELEKNKLKIAKLMKEVEIPETPKDANGAFIDSSFGWKYWKKHYWDYTDFSEEGILRTPIYHNKLMDFMSKRTEPIQDSVITSCHLVLDKALAVPFFVLLRSKLAFISYRSEVKLLACAFKLYVSLWFFSLVNK